MRHRLAACCLATLLALAASEQQPPWEHDDSGQHPRINKQTMAYFGLPADTFQDTAPSQA